MYIMVNRGIIETLERTRGARRSTLGRASSRTSAVLLANQLNRVHDLVAALDGIRERDLHALNRIRHCRELAHEPVAWTARIFGIFVEAGPDGRIGAVDALHLDLVHRRRT